jgi:hypothetical protein
MWGPTSVTLYPGMSAMMENATPDINNRSHTITADIKVPQDGGEGVIIAQRGRFAGWTFYMKRGKLKYCYNWLDKERYTIESKDSLSAGKATVKFEFKYDGGGVGKGGTGLLYVNGLKVAEGRIEHTAPFVFSGGRDGRRWRRPRDAGHRGLQRRKQQIHRHDRKVTIAITPPPAQVEKQVDRGDAVAQEGIE